jgi:pSer/pThr/pTyr-binding forkhead associated (FHA) protein
VPDPLLTLLKYVFLAVLYLFFLRVLRAVWIELREPKPAPAGTPAPAPAPSRAAPAPAAPVPAPGGPEHLVVVAPEPRRGLEFALGDELTVGRAGGCGVSLPDDTFVSQLHARVFRRDGKLFVEDLGSTNGTYVNEKKVTAPVAVGRGDHIQFGRTTMELRT